MVNEASSKTRTLAIVLGLAAGVLAWGAALVAYVKTGEVKLGLIVAGLFLPHCLSA